MGKAGVSGKAMSGWYETVSECCKAPIKWSSGNDPMKLCSLCGDGNWPRGVGVTTVYHPSDYERGLERRIEQLERIVEMLRQGK